MRFDRFVEAAAFIAALTRFIHSPACNASNLPLDAIQVWGCSADKTDGAELYFSDAALAASEVAFSPVPRVTACFELPAAATLVIDGCSTPPLGLVDAQQHLTMRCSSERRHRAPVAIDAPRGRRR
jgi:hypothetical protein